MGGVAREAALLRKVASTKSTAILTGPQESAAAAATQGSSLGLLRGSGISSANSLAGGGASLFGGTGRASVAGAGADSALLGPASTASVYLARRDFSALDNAFSSAGAAGLGLSTAGGTAAGGKSSKGAQRRLSTQGSAKYTRGLYLAGLRGMLSEMRGVRPAGTPAGHTQQLTARLTTGQARSKVSSTCVCSISGDAVVDVT